MPGQAPGAKVFVQHPLASDDLSSMRRRAKVMLVHCGRMVKRSTDIHVIEHDCLCYVNSSGQARTSFIERAADDKGWVLGEDVPGFVFPGQTEG